MTTARAIKGKVAKILNGRELIVNRGSDDSVLEGMRFQVLEPEMAIEDPDTKELLGVLQRKKIRVKVVEVHPKYCVAQTYETYLDASPRRLVASSLYEALGPGSVTRVRTLYGARSGVQAEVDSAGATVSVGDPVIQLIEEESSTPR